VASIAQDDPSPQQPQHQRQPCLLGIVWWLQLRWLAQPLCFRHAPRPRCARVHCEPACPACFQKCNNTCTIDYKITKTAEAVQHIAALCNVYTQHWHRLISILYLQNNCTCNVTEPNCDLTVLTFYVKSAHSLEVLPSHVSRQQQWHMLSCKLPQSEVFNCHCII